MANDCPRLLLVPTQMNSVITYIGRALSLCMQLAANDCATAHKNTSAIGTPELVRGLRQFCALSILDVQPKMICTERWTSLCRGIGLHNLGNPMRFAFISRYRIPRHRLVCNNMHFDKAGCPRSSSGAFVGACDQTAWPMSSRTESSRIWSTLWQSYSSQIIERVNEVGTSR